MDVLGEDGRVYMTAEDPPSDDDGLFGLDTLGVVEEDDEEAVTQRHGPGSGADTGQRWKIDHSTGDHRFEGTRSAPDPSMVSRADGQCAYSAQVYRQDTLSRL